MTPKSKRPADATPSDRPPKIEQLGGELDPTDILKGNGPQDRLIAALEAAADAEGLA